MPNPLNQRLAALQRERRLARAAAALLPALAVAAGVGAVSVLLVRVGFPAARDALWGVLGVCAVVPIALAIRAWSRREALSNVAAHLDSRAAADGLIMALAEVPAEERDAAWSARANDQLARARRPPLPLRRALPALATLVVLAASFIIPEREPPVVALPPPVDLHFAPTAKRLERLEALGVVPEAELARLRQELAELREEARRDGMSQAAWDGLDRVEEAFARDLERSERALAQAMAASRSLDKPRDGDPSAAEAMREAQAEREERRRRERDRLKPKPDEPAGAGENGAAAQAQERERLMERLTEERERERLNDLLKGLSELAQQAPGLMPELDAASQAALERLLDAAEGLDGLDQASLDALRKALDEAREAAGDPGGEPGEPGEGLTPAQIDALAKALEAGLGEGLGKLAGAGADGARVAALAAQLARALGAAGSGGPSRGGGAAPLTRGEAHQVAAGITAPLPDGSNVNPDGSVTLSVTRRAPEITADGEPASRAAQQDFSAFDADARRAHVAPQHRGAVGRYFAPSPEETP